MTFAALIAGIRAMDDEIARLRAHVAALTAAPATTIEPGLDLDARVPCASCGGEFRWSDDIMPGEWCALCHGCGSEWDGPPAPVTWRTLATSGAEVPAAYVARLVAEVDRLRALLTAAPVTTSPTTTTDGKPLPCPFCGSTDVDARTIAYVRCMTCEASGPTWPDDAGAVELWNTRAALSDSTTSPASSVDSGAEPTVEAGAFAGRRALPSAEATDYPVWIIVSGKYRDRYHAGPWFSREAATEHLVACRHRYPRGAIVYCHTGHMSADYRHLCETGTLPPKSGEVSDG